MDGWIEKQLDLLSKDNLALIHECWTRFLTDFIGKSVDDKQVIIESDILSTLAALQLEPSMHENYRRFVVIKGLQEEHIPADRDGVSMRVYLRFDNADPFV
jgi:hypothetical protein